MPINRVVVEIAKFDIQKLQNPDIEGAQYQQGPIYGYDNVRAYVFERDNYTCQICKKKEGILQTHHIKQRKDGGSDRPDNLATVHIKCHDNFHKGLVEHKFTKPKEYKAETQVTILKDYIVDGLKKEFEVEVTFGYITKHNRQRLELPKSHAFDAVAICNPEVVEKAGYVYKRVCVKQGRYQLTKGVRSEQKLPSGKLFGFRQWDKVKINGKSGFIKGKRSSGYFDVCDIDGNNISHSVKYTELQRLCSNNVMEVMVGCNANDNGIPPNNKLLGILPTIL